MHAAVLALSVALASACSEESLDAETDPEAPPAKLDAVNGTCAPHGQRFTDVYSCAEVEGPDPTSRSQEGPSVNVTDPDPARLDDPDLAWATAEIEACSCVCCHNDHGIGAYVWTHDLRPYFLDSMDDDRFSRITDPPPKSAPVIPPEENNGFSRAETGWPTTDGERLRGFFEREAARRGLD